MKKIEILLLIFVISLICCFILFPEGIGGLLIIILIVIFRSVDKMPKQDKGDKSPQSKPRTNPISIDEIIDYETMEDEYEEV